MRTFTGSRMRAYPSLLWSLSITVGLVLLASPISGFGTGAPMKACTTQKPGHGAAITSNYSIDVSAPIYKADTMLTVTVKGGDFRGIIMQMRQTGKMTPLGTWIEQAENTKTVKCSADNDTITHSNTKPKNNAMFKWKAPENIKDELQLVATVAKSKMEWSKDIKSSILKYKNSASSLIPPQSPKQARKRNRTLPDHRRRVVRPSSSRACLSLSRERLSSSRARLSSSRARLSSPGARQSSRARLSSSRARLSSPGARHSSRARLSSSRARLSSPGARHSSRERLSSSRARLSSSRARLSSSRARLSSPGARHSSRERLSSSRRNSHPRSASLVHPRLSPVQDGWKSLPISPVVTENPLHVGALMTMAFVFSRLFV